MQQTPPVVVGSRLYLGPCRVDCHVTCPAPGVRSCLHHLSHHVKKCQRGPGSPCTACTDVMEVTQSPPLSWEEQVQEEEDEQERHSSIGGDSQPCPSPARMEGCSISDVSMAEEGPQQGDSDVVVEEEVEENMETDEPPQCRLHPLPFWIKLSWRLLSPKLRMIATAMPRRRSTDQNPPHDSDLDEDELLGLATNVSIPGGALG